MLQRLVVGAEVYEPPFEVPHDPFVAVGVVGMTANAAFTEYAWSMVTTQVVWVPEHAPLHPAKVFPVLGVAVRVVCVFAVYVSVQSLPQVMPVPEIVPFPETEVLRV